MTMIFIGSLSHVCQFGGRKGRQTIILVVLRRSRTWAKNADWPRITRMSRIGTTQNNFVAASLCEAPASLTGRRLQAATASMSQMGHLTSVIQLDPRFDERRCPFGDTLAIHIRAIRAIRGRLFFPEIGAH